MRRCPGWRIAALLDWAPAKQAVAIFWWQCWQKKNLPKKSKQAVVIFWPFTILVASKNTSYKNQSGFLEKNLFHNRLLVQKSTYLVLNGNWLSTPHWGGLRYHRFLKIRSSSRAILYYTPQNVCKGNIPGVLFSWETEFCLEWVVRKQKKISLARKCFGCKFSFKATVSEKDTQHKGDTMKFSG